MPIIVRVKGIKKKMKIKISEIQRMESMVDQVQGMGKILEVQGMGKILEVQGMGKIQEVQGMEKILEVQGIRKMPEVQKKKIPVSQRMF